MTATTRILPPAELHPRVVPRSATLTDLATTRRGEIHAAVIEWRRLVVAVWQLGADEQYTGELPEGLSSQQFWAKVTRQARALGGEVGVACRGRRWWCWAVARGRMEAAVDRWKPAIRRLHLDGECWFDGVLAARDQAALREAGRRAGIGRMRFVKGTGEAAGRMGVVVKRNG